MSKPVEVARAQGWTAWLALAFFLIAIAILKFSFHELWKDEWQAWLIATDTTFSQMINLLPGEGHPALWFLLMRAAAWVGHLFLDRTFDVWILQSLHFGIVAATFYVFFICVRLPLWLKCGFSFSYFIFFEYGVVNRSYVLLALFAFGYVALMQRDKAKEWQKGLLLLLLCQTEIYGCIIALALFFLTILRDGTTIFLILKNVKTAWLQSSLLIAGFLIFMISVRSGAGIQLADGASVDWMWAAKGIQAISFDTLFIGLLPTVLGQFTFLSFALSIIALTALYFLFKHDKILVAGYFLFLLAMWLFTLLIYHGGLRQWGVHFVFFICMIALLPSNVKGIKWRYFLLGSIILLQGIHNFKIIRKEILYPFSNSKAAGSFISDKVNKSIPVIGINKPYCTPVIGYAGRNFYELPYGTSFSYFIWKQKHYIPSMRDIVAFAHQRAATELIVVNNRPMDLRHYKQLVLIKAFDEPNIRDEYYFIYRYKQ